MVDKAHKKLAYSDLDLWDSFIGYNITSVLSYSANAEEIVEIGKGRFAFPDKLYICSEDRVLIIKGNPNIYSRANPVSGIDIEKTVPVEGLRSILGATVTDISFKHREVSSGYGQSNIFIRLSNKMRIRFSTNFGEVPEEAAATYFEIL